MNNTKKILITGGCGFLGSHLCHNLLLQGHHITVLDNLSTGFTKNIDPLLNNPNFTFIKHDIINPIDLEVDWIFNLASPASPPQYQKDPLFTTKTNVIGSLNMLELAKKGNNVRILQASTSEVYGDPQVHPQPENYVGSVNPIGIRACYDESKRCAETLFFDYHRMHKVDIKVVRIFNTYGPNMDVHDGRVVSNFITQALQNKPLTIYGDGKQTRSFCYVDDLIAGIIAMMHSPKKFLGPVNLGNPDEFTILQLAQLIIDLTNSKSTIIFKPLPPDDPAKRKPAIALAETKLSWKPTVKLEEGLEKTMNYFKTQLKPFTKQSILQEH